MDIDIANLLLNIVTLIVGLIGGFICWKWIKPADAKMAKLQSELERNNDRIKDFRSCLLDSVVRNRESIYEHTVSACVAIFKAFQTLYSKSGFLGFFRVMYDLSTIWKNLSATERSRFGDFLRTIVPGEILNRKAVTTNLAESELFASARVWELYSLAELLIASIQLQVMSFGVMSEEVHIDKEKLYEQAESLIPGEGCVLRKLGTMRYWWLMERIRTELTKELRVCIGVPPITIDLLESNAISIENIIDRFPSEFRSKVLSNSNDCNEERG